MLQNFEGFMYTHLIEIYVKKPVCIRDPRKVDRRLRSKNLRPIEDCVRRFFVRSKNLRTLVEESSIAVFERSLRYLFERSYRREEAQILVAGFIPSFYAKFHEIW